MKRNSNGLLIDLFGGVGGAELAFEGIGFKIFITRAALGITLADLTKASSVELKAQTKSGEDVKHHQRCAMNVNPKISLL